MIQFQPNVAKLFKPSSLRFGLLNQEEARRLKEAYQEKRLAFMDIDTQVDFMEPFRVPRKGLPVPGAESIKANLKKLTDLAFNRRILQVASLDTHSLKDRKSRQHFKLFQAISDTHCLKGTPGWRKILETAIAHVKPWRVSLSPKTHDAPSPTTINRLRQAGRPIYIEKNDYDIFANKKTDRILKDAGIDTVVVYGVATDYCVQAAVKSLKEKGYAPVVVEDAIKEIANNGTTDPNHPVFGGVPTTTTDELHRLLPN